MDPFRMRAEHFLDQGIKAATGAAGRVEEFHDTHFGIALAQSRRMLADQTGAVLFCQLFGQFGFIGLEVERAGDKSQQQDDDGGDEQGFLHLATLKWIDNSVATMTEKASTDSIGRVRKPNQTTCSTEQGTPWLHGVMRSGITPLATPQWNRASNQPASASGSA